MAHKALLDHWLEIFLVFYKQWNTDFTAHSREKQESQVREEKQVNVEQL